MRPLQALIHSLQHGSSDHHGTHRQGVGLPPQNGSRQTAGRHDPRVIAGRIVSADPYEAWLAEREAEREREAHRLNPRAAWDDLKSQSFSAAGHR